MPLSLPLSVVIAYSSNSIPTDQKAFHITADDEHIPCNPCNLGPTSRVAEYRLGRSAVGLRLSYQGALNTDRLGR